MSIINISGTTPVDDPNYRYKMPMVVSKIEGKGNGIKSVIVNISDLALALHRDPGEVNKYFGCEIGAQTTYNEKDDKAIVNGAHTTSLLQKSIHKYIEAFVLCPNCRLPETDYKIKNGCINHRCKACGTKEMVDMGHKLCTYILAQHKKKMSEEKKAGKKKGKEKETEEEKKKSKKDKKKKDKDSDDDEKKKSKKDKKKKDKKKKDKKEKKSSDDDVPDDEDKSVDTEEGVDDAGAMRKFPFFFIYADFTFCPLHNYLIVIFL
jgi:translation initiation factor 5